MTTDGLQLSPRRYEYGHFGVEGEGFVVVNIILLGESLDDQPSFISFDGAIEFGLELACQFTTDKHFIWRKFGEIQSISVL